MISIDQKFQISFFYRKDETHSNIEIVLYSKEEWNYKKNILCEDVLRSPNQDSRSSPHTRPPHHTTPDPLSPDLSLLTGADSPIQIYLYISTFKKRAWQAEAVAFRIQMLKVRSPKSPRFKIQYFQRFSSRLNTETAKKEIPQTVLSIERRAGQWVIINKTPMANPHFTHGKKIHMSEVRPYCKWLKGRLSEHRSILSF